MNRHTTCLVMHTGSVACAGWGNLLGLLGILGSKSSSSDRFAPATALAGINVSSLGVGESHTCVLAAPSQDSKVYCIGGNDGGELGSGKNDSSLVLMPVQGLKQLPPDAQLTVSTWRACVFSAVPGGSSSVQCWGYGMGVLIGQTFVPQAVDVAGVDTAVSVAVGFTDACVVLRTGRVACWSFWVAGQPLIAAEVPGLSNVVRVAASSSLFKQCLCAIARREGEPSSLWCWGSGNYCMATESSSPRQVTGLPGNVVDVALGADHACALVDSSTDSSGGDVYCWGDNYFAQLGQGYFNTTPCSTPVSGVFTPILVRRLSRVRGLYSGTWHTCAATASQRVFCWGNNERGQLAVDPADQIKVDRRDSGNVLVPFPARMLGVCA